MTKLSDYELTREVHDALRMKLNILVKRLDRNASEAQLIEIERLSYCVSHVGQMLYDMSTDQPGQMKYPVVKPSKRK